MARKQHLINYHGSDESKLYVSDLMAGEIAVLHGTSKNSLFIKNGSDPAQLAEFIDSVAIEAKIETAISGVTTDLTELQNKVSANTDNITTLQTNMTQAQEDISSNTEAIKVLEGLVGETSVSDQIDAKINALDATVGTTTVASDKHVAVQVVETDGKLTGLTVTEDDIASANALSNLQGLVGDTSVSTQIDAKINALDVSNNSSDTVHGVTITVNENDGKVSKPSIAIAEGSVAQGNDNLVTGGQVYSADEGVKTALISGETEFDNFSKAGIKLRNHESRIITNEGLLANIPTTGVKKYVDDKVASVYRVMGSCTYAQLIAQTGQERGNVWNVTDACKHKNVDYPAGTNFVYESEASGQTGAEAWDALGGSYDLSIYHKTTDFNNWLANEENGFAKAKADISTNASAISTLNGDATTDGSVAKSIKDYVDTNVIASATTYTDFKKVEDQLNIIGGDALSEIEAGNGIDVTAKANHKQTVSAKIKTNETFLKVSGDGLYTEGVASSADLGTAKDRISTLEMLHKASGSTKMSVEAEVTAGIDALNATVSGKGSTNHVTVQVVETNGKLTGLTVTEDDIASANALSELSGTVNTNKTDISTLAGRMDTAEDDIDALEEKVGSESVSDQINTKINALDADIDSNGGTKVAINVVETDGKIASVTVSETDIASASALTTLENKVSTIESAYVKGAEITGLSASAIQAVFNANKLSFDLSGITIDCGEF